MIFRKVHLAVENPSLLRLYFRLFHWPLSARYMLPARLPRP